MVKVLNEKEVKNKHPRCIQLNIRKSENMSIEDFVTNNTIDIFRCLKIPAGVLDSDSERIIMPS